MEEIIKQIPKCKDNCDNDLKSRCDSDLDSDQNKFHSEESDTDISNIGKKPDIMLEELKSDHDFSYEAS